MPSEIVDVSSVQVGSATHTGAVRELNEDAVLTRSPVFVVADGMGGHAAGEVAAALALDELATLATVHPVQPEHVITAIESANRSILAWSADRPQTAGMGTTLCGVCLGSVGGTPHWFVFNVGDSRVYRYAGQRLTQVSTDHSEVEELVAAGQISRDEARTHARRNVVTRSLGTDPAPMPDLWVLPVTQGEIFVICSDGLPTELTDAQIREVLDRGLPPRATAEILVDSAVRAGGRDNVSVVVVAVDPSDEPEPVDVSTAPRLRLTEAAE